MSALDEEESELLLALLLHNWHVLPAMQAPETDQVLRTVLKEPDYETFSRAALAIEAFAQTQYAVTRPLLEELQKAGIEYCLLKGAAAATLLYERQQCRGGLDVDIAVRRHDLRRAEALAIKSGFLQAQQDPRTKRFHPADLRLRARAEAQHYELGFLVRRQFVTNLDEETLRAIRTTPWSHQYWHDVEGARGPWCYSAVDIHHGIALDIGLDAVIDHAWQTGEDSSSVSLPPLDWMATILIYKIYWEGVHEYRKGLYQYGDLCRLMPLLNDDEYLRFLEHLEELNLVAAAHYVVRRLPVFGVALAERDKALIELSDRVPDSRPAQVNDLGDMWPKLWGKRLLC